MISDCHSFVQPGKKKNKIPKIIGKTKSRLFCDRGPRLVETAVSLLYVILVTVDILNPLFPREPPPNQPYVVLSLAAACLVKIVVNGPRAVLVAVSVANVVRSTNEALPGFT